MLAGKRILLGISGSIAAYKAILLTRLLVSAGAEVKVIMTPAALDFVTPLTLSTLSKNKVLIQLADEDTWANHVMLGHWADVMIVAPASCNTISKMANGICDNLLLAAYLSATCPVVIAPAMDEDMWKHGSTKKNLETLIGYGNKVISVSSGELASGLFGEGRMAEPAEILTFVEENIFRTKEFENKNVLVTAGPTYEALDPVRFIGNYSSGKMGIAIAEELYSRGANVKLVCGPVNEKLCYRGIDVLKVTSASEMYEEAIKDFEKVDIAIMAAAVADYTPQEVAPEKIKKSDEQFHLNLRKTKDILKRLGELKQEGQLLIGFALETENEIENALKKLKSKNADMIVLNTLKDPQAGFGKDTNKVTILDHENRLDFEAKSKRDVARDIVDVIVKKIS